MSLNNSTKQYEPFPEFTELTGRYTRLLKEFSSKPGREMLPRYVEWRGQRHFDEVAQKTRDQLRNASTLMTGGMEAWLQQDSFRLKFESGLPGKLQDRAAMHEYVVELQAANPSAW